MKHTDLEDLAQQDPKRLAKVALQVFFNISAHWGLSIKQERILLGNPPASTFYAWKTNKEASKLDKGTLVRISYLMGIYKALHSLLPSDQAADGWLTQPNQAPLFDGDTALSRMLSGKVEGLAVVHRYLDAQCA